MSTTKDADVSGGVSRKSTPNHHLRVDTTDFGISRNSICDSVGICRPPVAKISKNNVENKKVSSALVLSPVERLQELSFLSKMTKLLVKQQQHPQLKTCTKNILQDPFVIEYIIHSIETQIKLTMKKQLQHHLLNDASRMIKRMIPESDLDCSRTSSENSCVINTRQRLLHIGLDSNCMTLSFCSFLIRIIQDGSPRIKHYIQKIQEKASANNNNQSDPNPVEDNNNNDSNNEQKRMKSLFPGLEQLKIPAVRVNEVRFILPARTTDTTTSTNATNSIIQDGSPRIKHYNPKIQKEPTIKTSNQQRQQQQQQQQHKGIDKLHCVDDRTDSDKKKSTNLVQQKSTTPVSLDNEFCDHHGPKNRNLVQVDKVRVIPPDHHSCNSLRILPQATVQNQNSSKRNSPASPAWLTAAKSIDDCIRSSSTYHVPHDSNPTYDVERPKKKQCLGTIPRSQKQTDHNILLSTFVESENPEAYTIRSKTDFGGITVKPDPDGIHCDELSSTKVHVPQQVPSIYMTTVCYISKYFGWMKP